MLGQSLSRGLRSPWLRLAIAIVAVCLLCWIAWQKRALLIDLLSKADPIWLSASIAFGIAANAMTGLLLRLFLLQHGEPVHPIEAAYLQLLAQIGKYIPGRVWGSLLQAQTRAASFHIYLLSGLELTLYLMLGLSGIGVALLMSKSHIWLALLFSVLSILFASILAHKAVLTRLILGTWSKFRGRAGTALKRSATSMHEFAVVGMVHAATHMISILALLVAVFGPNPKMLLTGAASLLLSWAIGNMAVIFPSGIGAREAAFVAIAHTVGMPAEIGTIVSIAIIARLAQVAQDLITAALIAPRFAASP